MISPSSLQWWGTVLFIVCAITQFTFTKRSSTGAAAWDIPPKIKYWWVPHLCAYVLEWSCLPLKHCVEIFMPVLEDYIVFMPPKKKKKTLCRILVEHCFHAPCITLCRALSWWWCFWRHWRCWFGSRTISVSHASSDRYSSSIPITWWASGGTHIMNAYHCWCFFFFFFSLQFARILYLW